MGLYAFLAPTDRRAVVRVRVSPPLSTIRKEFGNSESDSFLLLCSGGGADGVDPLGRGGHCVRKYDRRRADQTIPSSSLSVLPAFSAAARTATEGEASEMRLDSR